MMIFVETTRMRRALEDQDACFVNFNFTSVGARSWAL